DIGDFKDVPVIEVSVSAGDVIGVDDVLIVLESDKATMDIPSPVAGTVAEVRVKPGDTVTQGDVLLIMAQTAETGAPKPSTT
ncbi:biotin/lipoyl-containing protein, partial [Streptomyces caeruleatus]